MKIKNKIYTLLGVFTLVGLTYSFTLKDLNAALTAPASYDLNYQYDAVYEEAFMLGTTSIGDRNVIYTRTADSVYYNYTTTISNDIPSLDILPEGLSITMTFNRSNTNWFSITGGYLPADTKIGSNSSVGSKIGKVDLTFNNQTNLDYRLYVDTSSMTELFYRYYVNDVLWDIDSYYYKNTTLTNVLISSYTKIRLELPETSGARYFDAWYLEDLGVNGAYDAGVDAGYGQGQDDADLLITGFQAMVGILVNFVLMIVNLEVFGVSILSVFSILALFVGVIWILKIIRG
jgi:hypothetical protein